MSVCPLACPLACAIHALTGIVPSRVFRMGDFMKKNYIKADLLNASMALVLVWGMSSFFFDYFDPVLFEDTSEQLVA